MKPRFGKRPLKGRSHGNQANFADFHPNEQFRVYLCDARNQVVQDLGVAYADGNGFASVNIPSIPSGQGYKIVVGNNRVIGQCSVEG